MKVSESKPKERVCAIIVRLKPQLMRMLCSSLWTQIRASLLQQRERGQLPALQVVVMYDAAMAHKSVIRGETKHSELLFKFLNLGPLAHRQGAELLGLLVNAGDGPGCLQAVVGPKGSLTEQLLALCCDGVELPLEVIDGEIDLLEWLQNPRADAVDAGSDDAPNARSDDARAGSSAGGVNLPFGLFGISSDMAAIAPLMAFPGWSSHYNQPFVTMHSADRTVICPVTGVLLYSAPCNKDFEHTRSLVATAAASGEAIPPEFAVRSMPLWHEMLDDDYLSRDSGVLWKIFSTCARPKDREPYLFSERASECAGSSTTRTTRLQRRRARS